MPGVDKLRLGFFLSTFMTCMKLECSGTGTPHRLLRPTTRIVVRISNCDPGTCSGMESNEVPPGEVW